MRVMVTGISGLDRHKIWDNLRKNDRHKIQFFSIGETMMDIARSRNMGLDEDNILHTGSDTLSALRACAVSQIQPKLPKLGDPTEIAIISGHSLFSSKLDGLEEGMHTEDLKALAPEIWITLIDAPQTIEKRLKNHGAEYFHIPISDIVKWQEFEVFFSNHLAHDLKIKHYVVPVGQPEVFAAIATGDSKPTAYSSYAMSHASPEAKEKTIDFVKKLKDYYIVFDPSAIESSHKNENYYSPEDITAIRSHTIVRDLDWFIKMNAEEVIAYWPEIVFSSGMSDELKFAYEKGKKTVLVIEKTKDGQLPLLSPFMTYKCTVFWSSEDFFSYLNLSVENKHIFRICQEEMLKEFRHHDVGARTITENSFVTDCRTFIKARLNVEDTKLNEVDSIARNIYLSWKPILDHPSRRGNIRKG